MSVATRQNILQRMHAIMGEVSYIQKEKKQGMRYTIVSHDAVTAKVRPAFLKHGVIAYPVSISRSHNGNRCELDMVMRFACIDDPADYIDVATAGYGIDESDKGAGKAISYAAKYAVLKGLMLETGDDPDEDQNSHHVSEDEARKREKIAAAGQRVANGNAQHAADQWAEWAKGDDAKKWMKEAVATVGQLGTSEDIRKWQGMAETRKRLDALEEHHSDRFMWISDKIADRLLAVRAPLERLTPANHPG